jgi:hypothetical protein
MEVPNSIHRQLLLCNILSLHLTFCQQNFTAFYGCKLWRQGCNICKTCVCTGLKYLIRHTDRCSMCNEKGRYYSIIRTYVRACERD